MAKVLIADLDEILFDSREKRYGAYVLRKMYRFYLFFSFLIVLALFVLFTAGPVVYQKVWGNDEELTKKALSGDHIFKDLPSPPKDEPKTEAPIPPAPPKTEAPKPPAQIETIAVKIPEPKPAEMVKETATIEVVDSTHNKAVGTETKAGIKANPNEFIPEEPVAGGTGKGVSKPTQDEPTPAPKEKRKEPDPNIFVAATQPKPVNLGDIQKEIEYPQILRDVSEDGDVVLRILVDEEGNYVKHILIKTTHALFTQSVEKHVSKVKFTPAIQGGKPIAFWVNVPFKFHLN